MAATFVTSYNITDAVNTQSPSATQYNSNDGGGTLNKDLYKPTALTTPTIPTGLVGITTGAILDDGYSQKSLYELLLKIQVNWDNAMAALDDNAGVGTTTYEANCAFGTINENVLGGTYNIYPSGIGDDKLAVFLQAIATKFAACTALLDADATLDDENYASTLDLDFTAKTGGVSLTASATAFDITEAESYIKASGIKQGALVDYLNSVVTNYNALWVKLDADI